MAKIIVLRHRYRQHSQDRQRIKNGSRKGKSSCSMSPRPLPDTMKDEALIVGTRPWAMASCGHLGGIPRTNG